MLCVMSCVLLCVMLCLFSWQHVFNTAGLYLVHVICMTKSGSKVMISSRILVEVPITDLKLVGPTVVPVAG